jgi:hypothetical protein
VKSLSDPYGDLPAAFLRSRTTIARPIRASSNGRRSRESVWITLRPTATR